MKRTLLRYLLLALTLLPVVAGGILLACNAGAALPAPQAAAAPAATPPPLPAPVRTPAPSPSPLPTPVPTPFTLLWMGDTQAVMSYYDEFPRLMDWVAAELPRRNVVAYAHTGDVVDSIIGVTQRVRAADGLKKLSGLPGVVIAGNHDRNKRTRDFEEFRHMIYDDPDTLTDCYDRGLGRYVTFEAGGIPILLLGMSFHYDAASLAWMGDVLKQYPDRMAILLFHDYLRTNGVRKSLAQKVFDSLIAVYPNVRLVLCGHYDGFFVQRDAFDDDGDGTPEREALQIICNHQGLRQYRSAVQFLSFDPSAGTVELTCYAPLKDVFVDESCQTLPFDYTGFYPKQP